MMPKRRSMPSGGPADYPGAKPNQLQARVDGLRQVLTLRDPRELALHTGARYREIESGRGELTIQLWNESVTLDFPGFVGKNSAGKELNIVNQALLAYYFYTADGTPLQGRWISFAELPDGRFYGQAFHEYTGAELVRLFGDDLEIFEKAAQVAGGFKLSLGNRSFSFNLFPRVTLAVIYWLGDEEFPSNCQILFDAAAAQYLPTDACAIAGSMLTRHILAAHSR